MNDSERTLSVRQQDEITKSHLQRCFREYPIQIVHPRQMDEYRLRFTYHKGRRVKAVQEHELLICDVSTAGECLRFITIDLASRISFLLQWHIASNTWAWISATDDKEGFCIPGEVVLLMDPVLA